jgi:positive regulator of sigma E activity
MNRTARVVMQNNHCVTLELQRQAKCAGCPSHCNEPLLKLFSMRTNQFQLSLNSPEYTLVDSDNMFLGNLSEGQKVALKIDEVDLLKSSALLYLVPLLVCLLGAFIGHFAGQLSHLNADLTALLGLFVGLFVVAAAFKNKLMKKHLKFRPKVTISRIQGT